MADNYLITGYWGEPHVTAENDRGFNAAVFGSGKFVLPVGEKFRAEYIGNNTVRIYDGKLIDNGAVAGIPAGEYIDLLIPEAGQGMKRNDLIIFQYSQDSSTLIESGVFAVLSGTETSGTAVDPTLTEENILTNRATFDQMALWRVPVSGASISAPVQLFSIAKSTANAGEKVVSVASTDGVSYTADVDGVTELYVGLRMTIIPNIDSTTDSPTLNVNGLGSKGIRQKLSINTALAVPGAAADWLVKRYPVTVVYNGIYWVTEFTRPDANTMYGDPVEMLKNLIAENSGDELPEPGNVGRVFFKRVTANG